jgi:ribonuclease HII
MGPPIDGLRDSKLLTRRQREQLAAEIQISALALGLGWAMPAEIDELGLTAAISLAMQRAVDAITIEFNEIIIDGNFNFLPDDPRSKAIIKADLRMPVVSAASIIAKVARDNYMIEMAARYPVYGFDKHVGYGTALHRERLSLHGASSLHRRSFEPVRALLLR